MSDAADVVLSVFQLIGALVMLGVEVAEAQEKSNQRKKLLQAKESELMERLLGPGWQQRIKWEWFATHTICQRCERFFDTTDAKDRCSAERPFHTFTPVLDNVVRRVVTQAYGKRAPACFLPGNPFYAAVREVKPPQPLETDWVLMDENDNDAVEASASREVTPGRPVASAEKSVSVVPPKQHKPKDKARQQQQKQKQKQQQQQQHQKQQKQNRQQKTQPNNREQTSAASSSSSTSSAAASVPPAGSAAVVSPAPSAPPMESNNEVAAPQPSGGLSYNSAELLELAVMPDGVAPVSDKEALHSFRRMLSSLSPAELELLPHPPDVEPSSAADDDDAQEAGALHLAALPHPPSNEPELPPPSYAVAVQQQQQLLEE